MCIDCVKFRIKIMYAFKVCSYRIYCIYCIKESLDRSVRKRPNSPVHVQCLRKQSYSTSYFSLLLKYYAFKILLLAGLFSDNLERLDTLR